MTKVRLFIIVAASRRQIADLWWGDIQRIGTSPEQLYGSAQS